MTAERGGDKRGLTLLVQLFGREVLDRLARDGFDSAATIAAAGPDRLAAAGAIPLPLAERIVTVARETDVAAPESRKERGRDKNAPARRPAPKKPAEPVDEWPAGAGAGAAAGAAEGDPIVDDVALVSWMGFSSSAPGSRRNFSVADSILDPARPAMLPEIHQQPASTQPSRDPGPAANKSVLPDPAPPCVTLPGSFWSFGRPSDAGRPRPDAPSRRDHHDH